MVPGKELAGGRVFVLDELRIVLPDLPPGDIRAVAPNITSDPETGIGQWTDAQIAIAIREGRRPNGSLIGPPMPINLYRGLSDHDLKAILCAQRPTKTQRDHTTLDLPVPCRALWTADRSRGRPC